MTSTNVAVRGALLGILIAPTSPSEVARQAAEGVSMKDVKASADAKADYLADARHGQRKELVEEINRRAKELGSTDQRRRIIARCIKRGMTSDQLVALGFDPEHVPAGK